jgi:hypothetical protein
MPQGWISVTSPSNAARDFRVTSSRQSSARISVSGRKSSSELSVSSCRNSSLAYSMNYDSLRKGGETSTCNLTRAAPMAAMLNCENIHEQGQGLDLRYTQQAESLS